jgi:uncharacterized protein
MRRAMVLAVGAAGMLLVGMMAPREYSAADTAVTASRSITVNADGKAQVAPDVAFVTVGVQQTDIDAAKAQNQANTIAADALARIKALGIPDRDIQTSGISLDPQYDDRGTLTGFTATDTFTITVEQPRQAGKVIDAGVAAGANRNVSVGFGLKDDTQARTAALKAAVAVAQRKAAAVASQLGISLSGAKVQVVESGAQVPQPVFNTARVGAPAPGVAAPTPIQTGVLTIQDSVTVTYSF